MSTGKKCGIVIPVYRQIPLELEIVSLKQCCRMLGGYQLVILTYAALNIDEYIKIFEEYKIEYKIECFPQIYFLGIAGYNALMLSDKFYKRFLDYEYILIYQLDAYVFSSNLDYWLEQGYDYIGAPWFEEQKHTLKFQWVGCFNGGFCLKRTAVFYRLCFTHFIKIHKYFWKLSQINSQKYLIVLKCFLYFLQAVLFFIMKDRGFYEDYTWSNWLKEKGGYAFI